MTATARRALEARADAVRSRLAHRLDLLRDKSASLRHPLEAWRREPVASAILGSAGIALGLTVAYVAIASGGRSSRRGRWLAGPPATVAPPGFLVRMVERSITGVLVTSLTTVTKALLERALTGRHDVAVRRFATAPDPFPSHR